MRTLGRLVAWLLVMLLLLTAIGFGAGTVEVALWLGLLVGGTVVIVRRSRPTALT